jgi:hypothetical protein
MRQIILRAVFGATLLVSPAGTWFADGHEIVTMIASDDLTPTVRSHVAQTLGTPADKGAVEKAMIAASLRPDTEFCEEDEATAPATTSTFACRITKRTYQRGAYKGIA